jgi:hypothetical protein
MEKANIARNFAKNECFTLIYETREYGLCDLLLSNRYNTMVKFTKKKKLRSCKLIIRPRKPQILDFLVSL